MPSKNVPPVDKLLADKAEITLPNETKVTITHDSHDPREAQGAKVDRWSTVLKSGPVCNIVSPTAMKTDVIFKEAGTYIFAGFCWDRSGKESENVSEITITVNPVPNKNKPIDFGLKVVGENTADQVAVANKMNATMLRTSVEMQTFTGKAKFIDDVFSMGLITNANINWQASGTVRKFPTAAELITLEKNLRWFYDIYAPKKGFHKIKYAYYLNEPTVDAYFNDKIENYIPGLKIFAQVSNEYNVPCACGGVFIEFINASFSGGIPNNQNYKDCMWLIDQLVTIPLTHGNLHYALKGSYTPGVIYKAMTWLAAKLNRPVGTNEFHMDGASTSQVSAAMDEFISAQPDFIQAWGGSPDGGDPVNIGTTLTPIGEAMRDVIIEYNSKL